MPLNWSKCLQHTQKMQQHTKYLHKFCLIFHKSLEKDTSFANTKNTRTHQKKKNLNMGYTSSDRIKGWK
jgi:hypothetical protein